METLSVLMWTESLNATKCMRETPFLVQTLQYFCSTRTTILYLNSLRSRRLEVVGERENGSARETREGSTSSPGRFSLALEVGRCRGAPGKSALGTRLARGFSPARFFLCPLLPPAEQFSKCGGRSTLFWNVVGVGGGEEGGLYMQGYGLLKRFTWCRFKIYLYSCNSSITFFNWSNKRQRT